VTREGDRPVIAWVLHLDTFIHFETTELQRPYAGQISQFLTTCKN